MFAFGLLSVLDIRVRMKLENNLDNDDDEDDENYASELFFEKKHY
jgi:hypothetical protein